MADAEVQLELSNQEYYALQRKMEDMLATIAKEAEDIRKLEQELRDGTVEIYSASVPFNNLLSYPNSFLTPNSACAK